MHFGLHCIYPYLLPLHQFGMGVIKEQWQSWEKNFAITVLDTTFFGFNQRL